MDKLAFLALTEFYKGLPTDEFEFVVNHEGPGSGEGGRTISEGAYKDLIDMINAFIGARLTRRIENGSPASKVAVKVAVSIDARPGDRQQSSP